MLCLSTVMAFASGSQESGSSDDETRVAVILGLSGLGDLSFNDLVYTGLEKADEELGVKFDYVEPKSISDFETYMQQLASMETYDVILCIGFDQVDPLVKVAPQFPGQNFAIIDAFVEIPNVVSVVAQEHEGSFLAGALAGLVKASSLTNDNNEIGYIAALDIPSLNKFYAGYEAGARYVNPDVTVVPNFVGGNAPFSDITTAKEIALKQFSQGVDLIYHAAGGSGLGLFQAAKEAGFYAIGVNSNQNILEPDHIIASMLKRVDVAAYKICEQAKAGTLPLGELVSLGLADEGVGYTVEGSNVSIDPSIIEAVEALKQKVLDGELVVPDSPDKVDAFLESAAK